MDLSTLKQLGFSDKYAQVYLGLLGLGPSSVRILAEYTGVNRGTVHDALKWLQEMGVVTFYKKNSKQQFVAEPPEMLRRLLSRRKEDIDHAGKELDKYIPELAALYNAGGDRPVARYVEEAELHTILEGVLASCEASGEMVYRVYSVEGLREKLYKNFETFSDVRIAKGIAVRVIAIGEGGELRGLDERKWLREIPQHKNTTTQKHDRQPTYIILYPGKTAYISLNTKGEAMGVVIENDGVYETQRVIFDSLWGTL